MKTPKIDADHNCTKSDDMTVVSELCDFLGTHIPSERRRVRQAVLREIKSNSSLRQDETIQKPPSEEQLNRLDRLRSKLRTLDIIATERIATMEVLPEDDDTQGLLQLLAETLHSTSEQLDTLYCQLKGYEE